MIFYIEDFGSQIKRHYCTNSQNAIIYFRYSLNTFKAHSNDKKLCIPHFTTISGHVLANHFNVFHKNEALLIKND